ncbi:MAG: FitA-like ribbon-helix-helix domain-containing protein [Pseudomonadota bacterium]
MAQVLIRNLPDDVVDRLKERAAGKGRSLEQELREIVVTAAPLSTAERVAIIDRHLKQSKTEVRNDSTDFIREDRDSR